MKDRIAICFLSIICCLHLSCSTPVQKTEQEIVASAIQRVFPALVFIKPIQEDYEGGKKIKMQVFGSGAIISQDGYVVTNNHVAEKSTEIKCVLSNKEEIGADVVGLDQETDLAVLKLRLNELKTKDPLPFAKFGDSRKMKEGDNVMAMGSPYGFDRSISGGMISNTRRYFEFAPYNLWFQTDAAINPGNSGGPLVNEEGEIIGINSRAMTGAENMGFAIPSEIVTEIVDKLIKHNKVVRAWSGIRFQALKDFSKSSYINAEKGVLVASVDAESPAETAELKAGDIVLKCGDNEVNGIYQTDLPTVEKVFANLPIDSPVKLTVLRDKQLKEVWLTPMLKGKHEGDDFECKKWNMTVKEITKFSEQFIYFQKNKGAYVQGVKYGGNAYSSGITINDVIIKIEGIEIDGLKTLKEAYSKFENLEKGKRQVLINLLRNGYPLYVVLDFERNIEKIEEEE